MPTLSVLVSGNNEVLEPEALHAKIKAGHIR